jgi:hypothetical protein
MLKCFLETVKSENKTVEYVQGRLRSASEIYKKGGHVTMERRDQLFRMHYDNRRVLDWETSIPSTIEVLVDSKALNDTTHAENLRFIARMCKNKPYGKYSNRAKGVSVYRGVEEIAVRNFLKALLTTPPLFNLSRDEFYSFEDIILFVSGYKGSVKLTGSGLAMIQQRVQSYK